MATQDKLCARPVRKMADNRINLAISHDPQLLHASDRTSPRWRKPERRGCTLNRHFFAQADGYPSKPVGVVVPWPAGAITDALARRLSDQVSVQLGQPFIVDNRPGASGAIETSFAAKAAADGSR